MTQQPTDDAPAAGATEFKLLGPTLTYDDVSGWIEGHGLDLNTVAFVQLTPGGLHAEGGPVLEVYEYVKDESGDHTLIDGTDIPVIRRKIRRLRSLPEATPADDAGCNPEVSTDNTDTVRVVCEVHAWSHYLEEGNPVVRFSQIAEVVEAHRKDPHG